MIIHCVMTDSPIAKNFGGRRARKAHAVRQALFNSGLRAFERQPIALVSVLDITEGADVAKGVFYLQFRSKDDYLLALWREVQDRLLAELAVPSKGAKTLDDRCRALVVRMLGFAEVHPDVVKFWVRMSSYFPGEIGPPEQLQAVREHYLRALAGLLAGPQQWRGPDLQTARLLDALIWPAAAARMQGKILPLANVSTLTRIIAAATKRGR